MVTVGSAPTVGVEATGTGNSPPARNFSPHFPDSAIRFGSASRRTSTLVSSAVISTSSEAPLSFRTLVRRLAEPNLIALSGDSAEFLAGGEFPVPVASTPTWVAHRIQEIRR